MIISLAIKPEIIPYRVRGFLYEDFRKTLPDMHVVDATNLVAVTSAGRKCCR